MVEGVEGGGKGRAKWGKGRLEGMGQEEEGGALSRRVGGVTQ